MNHLEELLTGMAQRMDETAKPDLVVGQTLQAGDYKVIPLSGVSLGFGGGFGQGEGEDEAGVVSAGMGIGGSGGMRINPRAVILIGPEGVRLEPIGE